MAAARRETTRWTVPGWHGTRTGIAIATTLRAVPGVRCLWVRIPPVLLEVKRVQRPVVQWQRHLSHKERNGGSIPSGTTCEAPTRLIGERNGPRVRAAAWLSCLQGAGPSSILGRTLVGVRAKWAAGPMERPLPCKQKIGVRLPGGPLCDFPTMKPIRLARSPVIAEAGFSMRPGVCWKVAAYGWPGRTANAVSPRGMRVRIPCLPLESPDREQNEGSVGNLADHSRSKREMLRVRIPPEPTLGKHEIPRMTRDGNELLGTVAPETGLGEGDALRLVCLPL